MARAHAEQREVHISAHEEAEIHWGFAWLYGSEGLSSLRGFDHLQSLCVPKVSPVHYGQSMSHIGTSHGSMYVCDHAFQTAFSSSAYKHG